MPARPETGGLVPRGAARARIPRRVLVAALVGALGIILIVVLIAVAASGPQPPSPECPPGQVCEIPLPTALPLVLGERWTSSELGYRLVYDSDLWDRSGEDGRTLRLGFRGRDGDVSFVIEGAPAQEQSPQEMLQARVDALRQDVFDLAEDEAPHNQIFGPGVGYRDGIGQVYQGTVNTAQGPGQRVDVVIMSATDGQLTLVVSAVIPSLPPKREGLPGRLAYFFRVDSILSSVRFPEEAT